MPVSMLSTSLLSDKKSYSRFNALDTIYTPPQPPGMVLMKPTSITHSGTSATLGANGQVTFSAITSLSLNGCFTADFDNYVVSARLNCTTTTDFAAYLRAAGTDATSNYTRQYLTANGTSVTSAAVTGQSKLYSIYAGTGNNGFQLFMYGPYLAAPTATRHIATSAVSGARLGEEVNTHSASSSYDGISFQAASAFSGIITVYGLRS